MPVAVSKRDEANTHTADGASIASSIEPEPYVRGRRKMFENSLQAKPQGVSWGVIAGLAAFAVLLFLGYALVGAP